MPVYRGPKDDIDAVLRRLDAATRGKLVKKYVIFMPSGVVEIETTDKIPELKDYEVK